MSKKRNIRLKDIAEKVGVSVGTVDRVLHKRGKVSEDAKKKIEAVLENTGYKPIMIARTLGSNRTLHLTALLLDPTQDEYWSLSESGIAMSREEWSHYDVEISCQFFDLYDSSSFEKAATEALASAPDGILIAPVFDN